MANDQDNILRVEENGIEYYTVAATGESGVSQRGLTRLTEIPRNTLSQWLRDLSRNHPVKGLESLQGKVLNLSQNQPTKRGGKVKVIRAEYAYQIIEFAAFERGSKVARQVLKDSGLIGLPHFIQVKTGWTPSQYAAAPQVQERLSRILDIPNPWVRLYEPEFCQTVFSWFGAQFYWTWVYSFLTSEEQAKLNRLNPYNVITGDRAKRIHQYITPEARERLTKHVDQLTTVVLTSTCAQDFLTRMARLQGTNQLDLLD